MGIERLVLLTTRTADWFEQRSFVYDTYAHASALLPEARWACVVASRYPPCSITESSKATCLASLSAAPQGHSIRPLQQQCNLPVFSGRLYVCTRRNSKLYAKPIYNLGETSQVAPAGKRIGF